MAKAKLKIEKQNEGCIIVGVAQSGISEEIALEHLDELEFLATTAGAVTKKHFLQKLPVPNPKTYVGSGKLMALTCQFGTWVSLCTSTRESAISRATGN